MVLVLGSCLFDWLADLLDFLSNFGPSGRLEVVLWNSVRIVCM